MTNLHYLNLIWDRLEDMVAGSAPSAAIQLSTVNQLGHPDARTVILRQADRDEATVSFITDIRSQKVRELRSQSKVCAVAYDLATRVQIKLCGDAAIVQDEDARRSTWECLRPQTRRQFEADLPPSVMLPDDGNPIAPEEDGRRNRLRSSPLSPSPLRAPSGWMSPLRSTSGTSTIATARGLGEAIGSRLDFGKQARFRTS